MIIITILIYNYNDRLSTDQLILNFYMQHVASQLPLPTPSGILHETKQDGKLLAYQYSFAIYIHVR